MSSCSNIPPTSPQTPQSFNRVCSKRCCSCGDQQLQTGAGRQRPLLDPGGMTTIMTFPGQIWVLSCSLWPREPRLERRGADVHVDEAVATTQGAPRLLSASQAYSSVVWARADGRTGAEKAGGARVTS